MKNFCKTISLLLLLSPAVGRAYSVQALAVDSLGQAESFVTWRIFADNDSIHPLAGAVSGEDGAITAKLDSAGCYTLNLVGMSSEPLSVPFCLSASKPDINLGKLSLKARAEELEGITVTAQRPLVVKEIDRIGYDVQADIEAPTSTLSDILKKVPMVTVEDDGTIKVNGGSDFKIYRNGRPSSSFSKNAKDIFKAIPASSIRRIEVITDPGAREDAEGVGAILNIVTDSNTSLKGVTGSVSLYMNERNAIPRPNAYLTTQIGKFTLSVNGGYFNNNERETKSSSYGEAHYATTGNSQISEAEGTSSSNGGFGGLEMSFELDTLNLFTAEASMFLYNSNYDSNSLMRLVDTDGNDVMRYRTHSYYPSNNYHNIEAAINYQRSTRRKGETITLSYQISTNKDDTETNSDYTDMFNPPMNYTGIRSITNLNFVEQTAQVDWSRPYGEHHTVDLGGKYIHRMNHSVSDRDYVGSDVHTEDDFIHRTSVAAIYADYRAKFKKFGFRAGLRYEYSHLGAEYRLGDKRKFGSGLNDFAPNAAISYQVNDANSLKVSYNRRISRPGVYYLDPTVEELPMSTSQGNPHLNSATYNRFGINYSLIKPKFNLDANINYNFSNDAIGQTMKVVGEHTYYSYANENKERVWSFNAYVQWTPFEKTSFMFNGNAQHSTYKQADVSLARWSGNLYFRVSQKLPWKLDLMASVSYWSGWINGVYGYSLRKIPNYSLSLRRSFLDENRLNVMVSVYNPFGPRKSEFHNYSVNSDYTSKNVSTSKMSLVSLSVSYRFGSLQANVKKTAASISNDDLSGQKQQ